VVKLIETDYRQSRYDRPTRSYLCGLNQSGEGCELGPLANGDCPGRSHCVPFRKGDRWECTRTHSSGGKCEFGPSPEGKCPHIVKCVPNSNFRFIRRHAIILSVLLFLSIFTAIIASPLREQVLSPGPLSNAHSSIVGIDCVACHVNDLENPAGILSAALHPPGVFESNRKCLVCHQIGAQADLAHNVSSADLGTGKVIEISCSTCHQEHQQTLTEIGNARCDGCHTETHHPFEKNHPPFDNYQPNEISFLKFNHPKHFSEYFQDSKVAASAKQSCRSCHLVDERTGSMSVKPFQTTCSGCHEKDVRSLAKSNQGIDFLNVPALDLDTLKEQGVGIGTWPADIDDETISPFMAGFLMQDDEVRALLETIDEGDIDLLDLSDASAEDLARVSRMAWRIKELMASTLDEGHGYLLNQLDGMSSRDLKGEWGLVANLPLDDLQTGVQNWFLDYREELSRHSDNQLVATNPIYVDVDSLVSDLSQRMEFGGWYLTEYSLAYRPGGHGDSFSTGWLELSHVLGLTSQANPFRQVFSQLTSRGAPGACAKCHVLSDEASGLMQWTSTSEPDRGITHFEHSVHFMVVGDEGCVTCHESDASGFLELKKETCTTCHTSAGAGDQCMTCHTYHVGQFETELPNTGVDQILNR
jgi:hypothetical protein